MPEIVDIYTQAVYENLRPLYANWEPVKPMQLGDFGIVRGRTFVHLGNVASLDLKFATRETDQRDQKMFSSHGTAEVSFHAACSVPVEGVKAKASIEVAFTSEDAMFFNAAGCHYSMIEDKVALGHEIMKLLEAGKWDADWAIVTDLVTAESTTVAVSGARSSSIVFEATGEIPHIDLADAAVGLGVKNARNVGYQLAATKELTPLMGLCKVQSRFLGFGEEFKPMMKTRMRSLQPAQRKVGDPVEQAEDALYFGQLR